MSIDIEEYIIKGDTDSIRLKNDLIRKLHQLWVQEENDPNIAAVSGPDQYGRPTYVYPPELGFSSDIASFLESTGDFHQFIIEVLDIISSEPNELINTSLKTASIKNNTIQYCVSQFSVLCYIAYYFKPFKNPNTPRSFAYNSMFSKTWQLLGSRVLFEVFDLMKGPGPDSREGFMKFSEELFKYLNHGHNVEDLLDTNVELLISIFNINQTED